MKRVKKKQFLVYYDWKLSWVSLIYAEGLTLKAVLHVFARVHCFLNHKADHLETAFDHLDWLTWYCF